MFFGFQRRRNFHAQITKVFVRAIELAPVPGPASAREIILALGQKAQRALQFDYLTVWMVAKEILLRKPKRVSVKACRHENRDYSTVCVGHDHDEDAEEFEIWPSDWRPPRVPKERRAGQLDAVDDEGRPRRRQKKRRAGVKVISPAVVVRVPHVAAADEAGPEPADDADDVEVHLSSSSSDSSSDDEDSSDASTTSEERADDEPPPERLPAIHAAVPAPLPPPDFDADANAEVGRLRPGLQEPTLQEVQEAVGSQIQTQFGSRTNQSRFFLQVLQPMMVFRCLLG